MAGTNEKKSVVKKKTKKKKCKLDGLLPKLYRDRSVQFGHAVGPGHWVTIQLWYCDMVVD